MTRDTHRIEVSREFDGSRLDHFLCRTAPCLRHGSGLRAAQRLWRGFEIRVDGKTAAKGFTLRQGQTVTLKTIAEVPKDAFSDRIQIVTQTKEYMAVYKPAGLHTVSLAGAPSTSLEKALKKMMPQTPVLLLNRLDQPVSGLIMTAFSEHYVDIYKEYEDGSKVLKTYAALVQGTVWDTIQANWYIHAANRKKVKVDKNRLVDPIRTTTAIPTDCETPNGTTLLQVIIHKGARHQIRAHLAAAGHPIVGDSLYGSDESGILFLHHYKIQFPGFSADCLPDNAEFAELIENSGIIAQ